MPRPITSPQAKQLNTRLGRRVQARRRELDLDPASLERDLLLPAGALGRIERGEKSLDAGLIIALSGLLGVPVTFFFEDLPRPSIVEAIALPAAELISELTDFITQFHGIDDPGERRQILSLVRSMVESRRS